MFLNRWVKSVSIYMTIDIFGLIFTILFCVFPFSLLNL